MVAETAPLRQEIKRRSTLRRGTSTRPSTSTMTTPMSTRQLVDKFNGNNFLSFADRFKCMMILENVLYEEMFRVAESTEDSITDESFLRADGSMNQEKLSLSKRLKCFVVLHCDASIDPVLQAHTTEHGLELWRRLNERFDAKSRMTSMGRLSKIISMQFDTTNLETQLVLWEQEISKYEVETQSPLPDSIKIAVLINGTTGPLQEWIQLNGSNMQVYTNVRTSIVNYVRSKKTFSTSSMPPSPQICRRRLLHPWRSTLFGNSSKANLKAKAKTKEKAKARARAKAKALKKCLRDIMEVDSRPQCEVCGKRGHTSSTCWWSPQSTSAWSSTSANEFYDEWGNRWINATMQASSSAQPSSPAPPPISNVIQSTPPPGLEPGKRANEEGRSNRYTTAAIAPEGLPPNKTFIWAVLKQPDQEAEGDLQGEHQERRSTRIRT